MLFLYTFKIGFKSYFNAISSSSNIETIIQRNDIIKNK